MKYLDLIVTFDDVKMNLKKVKAIQNWKTSWSVKNMQAFLRFVNFYCQFIINFSQWTHFLTECSKNKIFLIRTEKWKIRYNLFTWIADCQKTFNDLKAVFLSASVLAYFDLNKKIWIEINVSNFVTAEIFSQMHDKVFWSVVFFSKKMFLIECNYMIYDKELLVII